MESPNTTETHRTEVSFYYGTHNDEDAEKFIDFAQNYDVLLLEGVGDSSDYRINLENSINLAAGLPESPKRTEILNNIEYSMGKDHYLTKVIKWAIDAGKEIHFVDVSTDHKENKLVSIADKEYERFIGLVKKVQLKEAYDSFKNYVGKAAQSLRPRNGVVQKQILNLLNLAGDRWLNKKILVFQGSAHRETYRQFKAENPDIKSVRFFDRDRMGFDLFDELMARLSSGKLSETDIQKAFLFYLVLKPGIENEDEAARTARSLTDEQIKRSFKELGRIEEFCDENAKDNYFAGLYLAKHVVILASSLSEEQLRR